jgi:hypothetical protein
VARFPFGGIGKRIVAVAKAVADAVRHPETYAPPPLPEAPPPPPARRPRPQPPERPAPRRYIPRDELPREWGRNEAALWSEATLHHPDVGRDLDAQALYDAALFTRSMTPGERAPILDNFKQYIWDEYDVDWDEIFDWEDYRENYDYAAHN